MRAYLDNAASTRLHPSVAAQMLEASRCFGNPSSLHHEGRCAREALDGARRRVAHVLEVDPEEVVFTASATESDNLALLGTRERLASLLGQRPGLVTTAIEHKAVLEPARVWERSGDPLTVVGVAGDGHVRTRDVVAAIDAHTALFSMMLANNETGAVQPVAECAQAIRALPREHRVLIHCDAAQAAGKLDVRPRALGVDLLTLSAHKVHGPRGAGMLYVRRGTPIAPQIRGGGHERGLRSGTENVVAAVGFAAALEIAERDHSTDVERMESARARLRAELAAAVPDLVFLIEDGPRLPNVLAFLVPGLSADAIVLAADLEGVALSSGSACEANEVKPSYVLLAMGLSADQARSAIRVSLAADTRDEELELAARALPRVMERLRRLR